MPINGVNEKVSNYKKNSVKLIVFISYMVNVPFVH